eukprot:TRINITY_DN6677_c0_g1_i16.p1 TRINITY_DN6677_c0_g1~~TRINITY_DN6677_c0_g1_i16.p1  ORF type:complete len:100 (-),score=16.09 TRINITY_DN6677_c0_g1_i16:332-631(-)
MDSPEVFIKQWYQRRVRGASKAPLGMHRYGRNFDEFRSDDESCPISVSDEDPSTVTIQKGGREGMSESTNFEIILFVLFPFLLLYTGSCLLYLVVMNFT